MMDEPKELSLTINKDDYQDDIQRVLKGIRPTWRQENTEIKSLSGGTVNRTLRVVHNGDYKDGFIVRINGTVGENFGMSREKELEYVKLLNKNGFGVPLIASFNNGIVSKLVPGKSLDDEILVNKMADKNFARKFAAILAKLHSIVPKDITPLTKDNYRMMVFVKCGFKMIRQISDLERLENLEGLSTWKELEKEIDHLYSEAEKLNMPICLSHNDLWHTNILYDADTDSINVIDYETMDINYAPFDIATYLVFLFRSHIVPGLPVPKNIDPDFPKYFIRCYLEAKAELEGKSTSSVTNEDVEKYYRWSQMCTLLYILLYIPGMIYLMYYQREHGEDVDYVQIARLWWKEYKVLKEEYKFW